MRIFQYICDRFRNIYNCFMTEDISQAKYSSRGFFFFFSILSIQSCASISELGCALVSSLTQHQFFWLQLQLILSKQNNMKKNNAQIFFHRFLSLTNNLSLIYFKSLKDYLFKKYIHLLNLCFESTFCDIFRREALLLVMLMVSSSMITNQC